MKHIFLGKFLILFSLSFAWSHPTFSEGVDEYQVTFDNSSPNTIHVKALITLEDSLLYMSQNGPVPERWPRYIRNIGVTNQDGKILEVIDNEAGGWILRGVNSGQRLFLHYDMSVDHESESWPGGIDGVAYVRDWGVMTSGRALFVMNGRHKNDIRIRFEVPDGWSISAPWRVLNEGSHTYSVPNLTELQETFLFAGTQSELLVEREGFTLKFVLGGPEVLKEQARFEAVASGVMDYYIDLMGGVPRLPGDNQTEQCMVIISQSDHVDGEVIGQHISMFMDLGGEQMNQLMGWFMFAHEFFHLWNGKSLRFTTSQTDWFKEGVSNYYTIKALNQIGFANEHLVFMILNNLFYQRYITDTGLGNMAPAEAAEGFSKDNHWGLIYGGGLFAGIAMDMEIRHKTGNRASLDDVMRNFYREYGGSDQTIDSNDILAKVNQIGNTDFSEFMKSYINGTDPILLAPYMRYAGIEADTSANQLRLHHLQDKTDLQSDIWAGFLGAH